MSQSPPAATTISLETVKQEFQQWRANRKHRSRIPEELWEAAASLTEQYSVHYISRYLGLNRTFPTPTYDIAVINYHGNSGG